MKILFVCGSNRKGNTEKILTELSKNVGIENEIILLKDKKINFCKGCLACYTKHECIIKDDMQDIIEKIKESDLIIFGIPNYFSNVSALFKNFLDRLNVTYRGEVLKDKNVMYVYVGGGSSERTLTELDNAVAGINKYLKFNKLGSYAFKNLQPGEIDESTFNRILTDIKLIG